MGKLTNVFALRFRGVDPERFLNWLYPYTGWFFRWPTVICVLLFASQRRRPGGGASSKSSSASCPTFHQFFGPKNWFYLGITMATVKVLHEFGHGLSCKHFGGECHELGAMMLVFTPALVLQRLRLLDVAQQMASGGHRRRGHVCRVVLASICHVSVVVQPAGLLNSICLSVMFICSVSTVVFNGNPLLRFDGYYILMDISSRDRGERPHVVRHRASRDRGPGRSRRHRVVRRAGRGVASVSPGVSRA